MYPGAHARKILLSQSYGIISSDHPSPEMAGRRRALVIDATAPVPTRSPSGAEVSSITSRGSAREGRSTRAARLFASREDVEGAARGARGEAGARARDRRCVPR